MMEILIDVNGSDNGMIEPIKAAVNMVDKTKAKLALVGDKEKINKVMLEVCNKKEKRNIENINIIDAKDEITNFDDPAMAIKTKKESSIVKAYEYMREHNDTVFVSAGSTGAVMAGGLLKLRRMEGIHRPALTTVLPTSSGNGVVLLDCGANVSAAGVSLLQYARMGALYAKHILNKEKVRIGMLNIGTEDKKGSPDLKETYELLATNCEGFVGNIEAREILSGDVDVVVTDGLMGNIALKSIEGTAKILKNALISEFKKSLGNKIKAVLVKGMISKALYKYDYTKYGGAVLLGVRKPVVKIHGNSKSNNYEVAIMQAEEILKSKLVDKISEEIEKE